MTTTLSCLESTLRPVTNRGVRVLSQLMGAGFAAVALLLAVLLLLPHGSGPPF